MKKYYLSPVSEEILIKTEGFLASSPDPDTTDPVKIIDEPKEGDLEEWG